MSSYSCVLPIEWGHFWREVMVSWLDLLSGCTTPLDFYTKHVPLGDESVEYVCLDISYRAPSNYLALFTDGHQRGWETTPISGSLAYREFAKSVDLFSTAILLEAAVKQSCSVELPGPDPFANEPHGGFYSRLTDKPHIQVAGTKNCYHFLRGIFTFDWHPSDHLYRLIPKNGMSHSVLALIESLFLGTPALPGIWLPSQIPSWPGFDDLTFAGYLAPNEVQALSEIIEDFNTVADEEDDDLFPLLVDRVQRAAGSELGLITLHGGL
jgi:hypothetical protein